VNSKARLAATSLLLGLAACHSTSGRAIRHSVFIAGPTFTGIIDEDGKVVWDSGRPGARDGFVLDNGNVLIAWSDVVEERTRAGRVVFRYAKAAVNQEIGTVQRLPDGNTLITELGKQPRLREIAPDGAVALEFALQPETDNAHMQTRMARKLANGNYLVPHLLAFKVKEYTAAGRVVAELATDRPELGGRQAENWPFTAIRLANGNTLVALTHGNKVAEFDAQGTLVWSVTNDDLPGKPLADACGCQRLPNGDTVIACYGQQAANGIKLFEVAPDKTIVWSYSGPFHVHDFQILTTNGEQLPGPPLK
jgi:Mal s 1 allergenic protein-like